MLRPIHEVSRMFDIPESTLRSWIERDLVESAWYDGKLQTQDDFMPIGYRAVLPAAFAIATGLPPRIASCILKHYRYSKSIGNTVFLSAAHLSHLVESFTVEGYVNTTHKG